MKNPLLPRGIRNNNPGNIRRTAVPWQGETADPGETSFCTFISPVMGLRALMRLLLGYYTRHQLDSVESLINRFAPPYENATDHYIESVARRLGVTRDAKLDLTQPDRLKALARAIIRHENGPPPQGRSDWYPDHAYAEALNLVFTP